MKPVVLISPYSAPTILGRSRNRLYAEEALADAIARGEAPFASHLLYPFVLNDDDDGERTLGFACETAWLDLAREAVVYVDRGISTGMAAEMLHCLRQGYRITFRSLDPMIVPASVDAMLQSAFTVADLFADVVLQLPASRNGANAPSGVLDAQGASQGVVATHTPSDGATGDVAPPAAPVARPDGPASSWGTGPDG